MKLVVDAMGGDHAPLEIVKGAIEASHELDAHIILVGRQKEIKQLLENYDAREDLISVVHAPDVIEFDESPLKAVRHKSKSSIVVGMKMVQHKQADVFISAGNSGAIVASAVISLGRVKGISRPSLSIMIPAPTGPTLLLDVGANANCTPFSILNFAQIGTVYMRRVYGIGQPRVGLLSTGEESSKGNELIEESHHLLQKSHLNFIGNIEGNDLSRGLADVIVTDGFTGNVVLKTMEGVGESFIEFFRELVVTDSNFKDAAPLFRMALSAFTKRWDYSEHGGSILFGVNGNVIVSHGRSRSKAIKNALSLAYATVAKDVLEAIKHGYK